MICTGRQRLVNTLYDPYDSYEWTSQLYESIQVVSIGQPSQKRGFKVFAVQNGGWRASDALAEQHYQWYGPSKACHPDGAGGQPGLPNHRSAINTDLSGENAFAQLRLVQRLSTHLLSELRMAPWNVTSTLRTDQFETSTSPLRVPLDRPTNDPHTFHRITWGSRKIYNPLLKDKPLRNHNLITHMGHTRQPTWKGPGGPMVGYRSRGTGLGSPSCFLTWAGHPPSGRDTSEPRLLECHYGTSHSSQLEPSLGIVWHPLGSELASYLNEIKLKFSSNWANFPPFGQVSQLEPSFVTVGDWPRGRSQTIEWFLASWLALAVTAFGYPPIQVWILLLGLVGNNVWPGLYSEYR